MNTFLKATIDEAVDLAQVTEALVAKDYADAVGSVVKAIQDAPALTGSLSDAKSELSQLVSNPAADADLLAYVASKAGVLPAKAAPVVVASADLALTLLGKVEALVEAVKQAKA